MHGHSLEPDQLDQLQLNFKIETPTYNTTIEFSPDFTVSTQKKFNWFHRKMIQLFFGFYVRNNK